MTKRDDRARRNMTALWNMVASAHPDWTSTEVRMFIENDLKMPRERSVKRRKRRSR
ncbi:MAG: hypothetical protein ACW99U_17745 [Candidatus Thorarchaeota archaeon]